MPGDLHEGFPQLNEREILAVVITTEDDDRRVYLAFAEDLRERYPATKTLAAEIERACGRNHHRDQ